MIYSDDPREMDYGIGGGEILDRGVTDGKTHMREASSSIIFNPDKDSEGRPTENYQAWEKTVYDGDEGGLLVQTRECLVTDAITCADARIVRADGEYGVVEQLPQELAVATLMQRARTEREARMVRGLKDRFLDD